MDLILSVKRWQLARVYRENILCFWKYRITILSSSGTYSSSFTTQNSLQFKNVWVSSVVRIFYPHRWFHWVRRTALTPGNRKTHNPWNQWIKIDIRDHRTHTFSRIMQRISLHRLQLHETCCTAEQKTTESPTRRTRVTQRRENGRARRAQKRACLTFSPCTTVVQQKEDIWRRCLCRSS